MKKVGLALASIVLLLVGVRCYQLRRLPWDEPRITFRAVRAADDVEFEIGLVYARSIQELILTDKATHERLWWVELNYFPGPRIRYGKVPVAFITFNGQVGSASQEFPKGDVPPKALPVAKEILVQVDYDYDDWLDEYGRTCWYLMVLAPDGQIRYWETDSLGNSLQP